MSITVDFLDLPRVVPEVSEVDWGEEVTAQLVDLLKAADFALFRDLDSNFGLREQSATATPVDASTITITAPVMSVAGSGGPVTLSDTAAFSAGFKDGQILKLIGTDDTNTVRVLNDAGTLLNGSITLSVGTILELIWNTTMNLWVEVGRNN